MGHFSIQVVSPWVGSLKFSQGLDLATDLLLLLLLFRLCGCVKNIWKKQYLEKKVSALRCHKFHVPTASAYWKSLGTCRMIHSEAQGGP